MAVQEAAGATCVRGGGSGAQPGGAAGGAPAPYVVQISLAVTAKTKFSAARPAAALGAGAWPAQPPPAPDVLPRPRAPSAAAPKSSVPGSSPATKEAPTAATVAAPAAAAPPTAPAAAAAEPAPQPAAHALSIQWTGLGGGEHSSGPLAGTMLTEVTR